MIDDVQSRADDLDQQADLTLLEQGKLGASPMLCQSCGSISAIYRRITGTSHREFQCFECARSLARQIKRARLRRDTYDLAVLEHRQLFPGDRDKARSIDHMMRDAGFRDITLTQIGLGY